MINKITLIRPGKYSEGLIVPLGLLYLAGYIQEKSPETIIEIFDATLHDLNCEDLVRKLKESKPDLIGLTGLTVHAPDMKEAAHAIAKALPRVIIVAGGPAITADCERILKDSVIHYGVLGEGEETFYQLIDLLRKQKDVRDIDGLAYKNGKDVVVNKRRLMIKDIDSIPFPFYSLINIDDYFNSKKRIAQSPIYISKRNLPILSSRGCPYGCIYCHDTFGKAFRSRSPKNVVKEILFLKQTYNFDELEIIDDIFNFDNERAKEIFRHIIDADLDLKISFPNGIKVEMIDEEILDLFKKAGVYRIAFGIESGNKRIQNIIRKPIDLELMRKVIDQSYQKGFFVSGFFQLGLPGERKEEMLDTIQFACSSKLHTAMFHLTIPFPGTPMHEQFIKGKREFDNFESCRDISVNLSTVSDKELLQIKRYAFFKFYINARRIWSIYKTFPVKKRLFYNFINVLSEMIFRKWIVNT